MPQELTVILPLLCLLLGIALELLGGRWLNNRTKGWLALGACLGALLGVLNALIQIERGGPLGVMLANWDGPVKIAYYADGLSMLFALMATGIGAAVLLYSVDYMAQEHGTTRFYTLMLVFILGLVHLVFSADLFALYVGWEIIGLCSFLLVGFWYTQPEAAAGARKVLVMTHIAGYGLFAALMIVFARSGSTLWTDPKVQGAFSAGLFVLILISILAKSVQFPLHTWIPSAMAAPTPVSALLHAACYVKAGVYLLARLYSLGIWQPWSHTLVIWIGLVTIVVGIAYAMIQTDLKRMLAFSTVSQIGYMVLGLGLGTPLGIAAGLLHCLNHGLCKGGLFLGAGIVQHETGTRDMNKLGGLAQRLPRTSLLWLIGAGSIAGLPLLSGFVSKWMLYNAALQAGQPVAALLAWIASIATMFAFLRATSAVFFGDTSPETSHAHEPPRTMLWGMGLLTAGSLVLGVAPQLAINYLINPLLPALGMSPLSNVSWLGLEVSTGTWWTTGGLVMALVAVAVGVLIYLIFQSSRRPAVTLQSAVVGGVFTGGEPLSGPARIPASDISAIIQHNLQPFYQSFDVDAIYLYCWRTANRAAAWIGKIGLTLEERVVWWLPILVVALIAIVGLTQPGPIGEIGKAVHTGPAQLNGLLLIGCSLAWLGILTAAWSKQESRRDLPLMLLVGLFALSAWVIDSSLLRLVLLETAAVLTLSLVWQRNTTRSAVTAYCVAVLFSAGLLIASELLREWDQPGWAAVLLLVGFAVKLALIPVGFWLPRVVAAIPAAIAGLLIAIVDMSAFAELWTVRQTLPTWFANPTPWLILAACSALFGGILMLAQRDVKRLLAFSTIEDMGYLTACVALAGDLGLQGALIGALAHTLAKALLFAALVSPETSGSVTLDRRGLASRFPFSGAAFIVGTLTMLGIPPTLGFLARWRIYLTAYQTTSWLMIIFMFATGLALLAYLRVIYVCWWGPTSQNEAIVQETRSIRAALLILMILLLAAGVWPPILSLVGGIR